MNRNTNEMKTCVWYPAPLIIVLFIVSQAPVYAQQQALQKAVKDAS